jgi:photosystem II stability/assembly factor-like uncharacterized protein
MPAALEDFWSQQEKFTHVPRLNWEEAGPSNFAGRVTCLLIDPANPLNLFAGSAAGGVWRTVDGGQDWTPCWPKYLNQNIGAMAIDPADSTRLICATGEGNMSSDCYPGSGVYVTGDAGLTWIPYLTAPGGGPLQDQARAQLPRRIGTVAFGRDQQKQFRVALGAVSSDESLPAALYMDQGEQGIVADTTWGIRSYNCYAVVFHPVENNVMYVAIQPRGAQNGIWKSNDFGKTWTHLKRGLPPGELCARISLAISPSHPNVLYALVASTSHDVLGVFRTQNGGDSWTEIGRRHFENESQLSYNNTIAVHPANPDFVVCGAVDLHLTRNGGKKWTRVTTGERGSGGEPFPPNYVHSDHHAIVIDADGRIFSGNDGGVALSVDGGRSWMDRSNGMVTTMFYAADVAQSNSHVFGGGTQDNGTLIAGVPSNTGEPTPPEREFTRVLSSDGGWIEFDPADEQHVFGSTQDLAISRHRRGEPWAAGLQLAGWPAVSISPDLITPTEQDLRGMAVLEIEPRRRKGTKKLWLGTNRLWRTDNDGRTWKPVSHSFDDSAISAVECAASNPRILFVGTSLGKIFRSTDAGVTWSGNLANAAIPQRLITRIGTHPKHAKRVVATVAASGVPGTSLDTSSSPGLPYAHVFESDDLGVTWRPLDGLPDVVYNALAFESHDPYRLFVGGDSGVWMHDGTSWASVAGNMPNVIVSDLIFHHRDQILTAATFGRGFWRLKVREPFPITLPLDTSVAADDPLAAGLMRDSSIPAPQLSSPDDGAQFSNFPRTTTLEWHPVTGAIAYTVDVFSGGTGNSYSSEQSSLKFDFWGASEATWRVWAIFPESRRSLGSVMRSFKYSV